MDDGDGFWNFRVLKLANVFIQHTHLRIQGLGAQRRILQEHLLLQNCPGEDGVNKVTVKFRIPLQIALILVRNPLEPISGLLRHGGVGILLFLAQIQSITVEA